MYEELNCRREKGLKHALISEAMPKIIFAVNVTVARNKWSF